MQTSNPTSPLLKIKNISRYYHDEDGHITVRALDDVSLTINHGEFVAIMGQSGSGKSTLMNILGILDTPTSGTYEIQGHNVAALTPDEQAALRRETFGFIFQRYNLLGNNTAAENVEIPAIYAGTPAHARRQKATDILTSLGLSDRLNNRPGQLSGGQQQRVAIARALINDPPAILADEPTGALDSKSGQDVMELLKSLHAQGRTIILITHDENVAAHANRIIRIQDGKILEDSGPTSAPTTDAPTLNFNRHGSLLTEISESIKTAFRSLRANKFRTALTLLGIIIGVAAVITMLAIGEGSKQKVLNQISTLGTNLLTIRPGIPGMRSSGDVVSLTPDDLPQIAAIENVAAVVPERTGRKTVRFGNTDHATSIQGVGTAFPFVRDWPLSSGTFFIEKDEASYASVAVLGATVSKTLFPSENAVGKFILIGNIPFEVIGTLSAKGAAPWGSDQDDAVFVPYTTAMVRLFGGNHLGSITARIIDADNVEETEIAIKQTLMTHRKTEDFSILNTASFLEMATATQNTLTILLGAVAAISLLVGGIGVMNIMLVSVTERTREIGIRMATGARMRDIMVQFNTEAAVVCTIGGLLGVALGISAGLAISMFGVDVVFTAAPALLAFACAVFTGLLFGYLPARKAARLDPVMALSTE